MWLPSILTFIIFFPCFDCKLCNENPPTSYLCTFQNGSKIDITSLGLKGKPGFKSYKNDDNSEVIKYNPRYNFTINGTCKDAAACQFVTISSKVSTYLLATQEVDSWTECTASSGEKATCINFKKIETTNRTTILELICDLNGGDTGEFNYVAENPTLTYHLSLKSKYACATTSSRLSFGSVLCITFSVLVIVYVVVGILVNRFVRGANGLELFPNYQFWSGFPSLVKIGQCANEFLQNMDLPKFKIYSVFFNAPLHL